MVAFAGYEEHDAVGLAALVSKGEAQPRELLEAAVERIEERDPTLNAVIHRTFERAEQRLAAGLPEGPFTGVPFLVKDTLAYRGEPLTYGSRSMRDFVPDYNATLTDRYERAGLVIVGKTNTPEFGLTPTTEPELWGITANPWNVHRSAGGSSGGSAAAVASGMVPAAHASDGGGSIRIPAAHCGLFGFKPTRARTPSGPILGEAWFGFSISHVLSRSVRDSAALLDATHGPEPGDPYAAPLPERPFAEEVGTDPGRLRVGVVNGSMLGGEVDPECRQAAENTARMLEEMGHRVTHVELPLSGEEFMESFTTLVAADAQLTLEQTAEAAGKDRPDPEDYELATWVLGLVGRQLPASAVPAALFELRSLGRRIGRVFQRLDLLVSPTVARPPWPHGALDPNAIEQRVLEGLRRAPVKPLLLPVFRQLGRRILTEIPNTPLFNVTGQPAMSLPLHWTADGLPVGVQIAAPFGEDATLFRVAARLEEARPWFDRQPPGTG